MNYQISSNHLGKKLTAALALALAGVANSPLGVEVQSWWNRDSLKYIVADASAAVQEIEPTLKEGRRAAAGAAVQAEYLGEEIAQQETMLAGSEREMRQLATALADKSLQKFVFDGRTFSRKQVEADLASRMQIHSRLMTYLTKLRQQKESAESSLNEYEEDLVAAHRSREGALAEIEMLSAMQDLMQVGAKLQDLGATQRGIGRVESLMDKARRAVEVEARTQSPDFVTEGTIHVTPDNESPADSFFAKFGRN